jgi:hypothetical protein
MNALQTCALCREVRELRDSHIIPEFLYATLYDEKHRINAYGSSGDPVLRQEQKGSRERLLCDECEQQFCAYEQFASDFFRGALDAFADATKPEVRSGRGLTFTRFEVSGDQATPTTARVPTCLTVDGMDYRRLKLFLLSLLWRMGVSDLYFFQEVALGPHEEKIRNMLRREDPGEPDEYACKMRLIEVDNRLLTDCQMQPRKYLSNSKTFYRLFTTGVRFDFCVSNQPIHPGMVRLYCVKREPKFVWLIESIHKHPDLIAEILKLGFDLNWS